ALLASFPAETHDEQVALPRFDRIEGARAHRFELACWHTWMDPLGHVNHPAYIDFADEATSRAMKSAGLDPVKLVPLAEEAGFRGGIVGGEDSAIEPRVIGALGDAVVLEHRIEANGTGRARVVAIRRAIGDGADSSLLALR